MRIIKIIMEIQDFFQISGLAFAVMLGLGLIGNIISCITWRAGRRCKNLPGAVYLTALAVSDSLALVTSGFKHAIELLYGKNLWNLNAVSCTVLHTTWHLFFLISTWIVVSLTIMRTIAVSQPFKTTIRTSKKTELTVAGVLSFLFLLINLPFTFGARLMPANRNSGGNTHTNATMGTNDSDFKTEQLNVSTLAKVPQEMKCQADPDSFYYKYEVEYHNWFVDFCLLFVVPVAILTVCNIIIVVTLARRRWNTALKESHFKEGLSGAMTVRVMLLSLVQCVSVGPFSIAALIPGAVPDIKAVDTVHLDQLFEILVIVWYLNNCVNFILYSLFGKAFRRDCADLFRKAFRCHKLRTSNMTLSQDKKDLRTSNIALVESTSSENSSRP